MLDYAVRRICLLIPTLLITSLCLFFAMRTLPSQDAIELTLGPQVIHDNPGLADQQRKALGISGPLTKQYLRWVGGFVTGNWGKSLVSRHSIASEIKNRIPVSMEISLVSLFVTWVISFPLGVFAAVNQDRFPDYVLRTIAYA